MRALGGSLPALLPRLTVDFDLIGQRTPLLVDLKPSGTAYMEDFYKVRFPQYWGFRLKLTHRRAVFQLSWTSSGLSSTSTP